MNEKSITTITLKKINKKSVYQYIYEHRQTAKQQIVQDLTMGLSMHSGTLEHDMIVIDMFVPVSPSGTGKTFSSLIHSFFASRFFAPARNILDKLSVLILVISNFLSSLVNHADAFDVDIDLIDLHARQ